MDISQGYSEAVNKALAEGHDDAPQIYERLREEATTLEEQANLDFLHQVYLEARMPSSFFELPITTPDLTFEAFYALLSNTFDPAELLPKEYFLFGFERMKTQPQPSNYILVGRFWRTLGPQLYSPDGDLSQFVYDPLTVSQHIASLLTGNYMPIQSEVNSAGSIGAISYIATRKALRGHGHSQALLASFEKSILQLAELRGQIPILLFAEASEGSQGFWARSGYRWPSHVYYAQPPIDFDEQTGAPLFHEVPETLMIKMIGDGEHKSIDVRLLQDIVTTIYNNWYLIRAASFPALAAQRARDYVMQKVYGDFLASLPSDSSTIPLVVPPISS